MASARVDGIKGEVRPVLFVSLSARTGNTAGQFYSSSDFTKFLSLYKVLS